MPAITTNDLKNGMTLQLDNGLFTVVDFQHVKPGKGGAFVRTTLRNSRTGAVIDRTFRAAERVEQAILEKKDMQFLYRDGDEYVFMDTQSYDQLHVAPAALGPAAHFLVESATVNLATYQDEIIGVELPASVELRVSETEPGVQGDRVSGARKPATLETGHTLQVPLFVNPGDRIKVDTRSGDYITRASDGDRPVVSTEDRRTEARERALALLYEADSKATTPAAVLAALPAPPDPLARLLVEGVADHQERIDGLLGAHARGWTVERMPVTDRTVARIAIFELLERPDVPTAVILDEAVELAKRYGGTDDSGRFVNGVLAAVAAAVRPVEGPDA